MRVLECNECGETLSAADDSELATCFVAHMRDEHDESLGEEEAGELIGAQAYDASDS